MADFRIKLDDKPNLTQAMEDNPKLAKEVIGTFVSLMEEAFDPEKGIRWADLPGELHKDLTFGDLVRGILRGTMDTKAINPDSFDALKVEVHPLAILSPRKNYIDGGQRYFNWRNHFKLPDGILVNEQTVSQIFQKMLRYARYIRFEELQKALESNQIAAHRGLGHEQVAKLPFIPALKYQRRVFGELAVGKFYDDIGAFDCGLIGEDEKNCLACETSELHNLGKYRLCLSCNSGYIV